MRDAFLIDEQREIELECINEGVLRYTDQVQWKETSQTVPGARLLNSCMKRLTPAIEELRLAAARGERSQGVRHWGYPLLSVPAQHLAVITLTAMVDNSGGTRSKVAFAIADGVRMERRYQTLKKEQPDVLAKIKRFIKDPKASRQRIRTAHKKIAALDTQWPHEVQLWVGAILLETAMKVLPEFERSHWGPRYDRKIQLTVESLRILERDHEEMGLYSPTKKPMIVEPMPWEAMYKGGYLLNDNPETSTMRLIKEHTTGHRDLATLGETLDAVNHLQKTRWAINSRVLDVLDAVYNAGGGIAGVIIKDMPPLPEKPEGFFTDPEVKKAWRFEAWKMYQDDKARRGRRCVTLKTSSLAHKYKKREAIWFVWTSDFRGRMYPAGNLSPHSDDIGRGLLHFAEAKPLGPDGFYWLSIHLANCYGGPLKLDKAPLKERYEWCRKNRDEILRWAEDPLTYKGWADADDPFKCLAASFEWAEASRMADPAGYQSRLYISMDGTCNGLQWLSAIGRDPIGGHATNLVPTEKPNDIYALVAQAVDKIIEEDIKEWRLAGQPSMDEMLAVIKEHKPVFTRTRKEYVNEVVPQYRRWIGAQNWKGKVNRKVCKRGTMTSPYGVTQKGIRDQLVIDGFLDDISGDRNLNADYMQRCIYRAIGEVVVSARKIMDWLQECARKACDQGKSISWTTPCGMQVRQEYLKPQIKDILVAGVRYYYPAPSKERKLLRRRQINGVAPNFVHSIDASHLTKVVLRLRDDGIRDMLMVHDSFGVHACHVGTLHKAIRETFVEIASTDILGNFKREVEDQLGITLPDPPECGDLDIRQVLEATYAFC